MKRIIEIVIKLVLLSSIVCCSNFQEGEVPVNFGVNVSELSFDTDSSLRPVIISSGTKWSVSNMPSWISLQSINPSGSSPNEWTANFLVDSNDGYNREGRIIITAKSESAEIAVLQEGKKGKYVAVESVSISPTELTLTEGESSTLVYTISPSYASVKDVIWKSSSPSVVTVSGNGKVEAIAVGTTMVTVTTEDGENTASCFVTVKARLIPVESVSLDKTSLLMAVGDTQTLTATVTPLNATDKSVSWSSSNSSVATVSSLGIVTAKTAGTATIRVTTNDGLKTTSCLVEVKQALFVDLGLSVKWATCNLGASSPEEYGDYYAWGEINPKVTGFTPLNYKWFQLLSRANNGDEYDSLILKVLKYSCGPRQKSYAEDDLLMVRLYETELDELGFDNTLCLQQEDDAARLRLGLGWRIPTDEEWNELIEECDWSFEIINGVHGCKVLSKTTHQSIFLPFAGFGSGDGIVGLGVYGDFWASTCDSNRPFSAKSISCDQSGAISHAGWYRYRGLSIRPVSE